MRAKPFCVLQQKNLGQSFGTSKSKDEGKNQKKIQSSTTLDPGERMGSYNNTRKHHTQEIQKVSPFPAS